jgi:hypothetical protein
MRASGTLVFLAFLTCVAAAQAPPAPPVADASIHGYGDRDTTCAEWTDGCRTCRRDEAGAPVCSNIGPTCQPAAITCSRKVEPAR